MLIDTEIESRVQEIHRDRNKNIWLYHSFLLIISIYFFWKNFSLSNVWSFSVLVILIAITTHGLIFTPTFNSAFKSGKKLTEFLQYCSLGMMAMGWSMFLWVIKSTFGIQSPQFMSAMILIAGLATCSALVFQTLRPLFYLYTGILCATSMLIFCMEGPQWQWTSLLVFVFFLFNINMLNEGHRQILASVSNEHMARIGRDRLSKLMDTVPGYLGIFDKNKVCLIANKAAREAYPDLVGNKIGNNDPGCNWEKLIHDFIEGDEQHYIGEALVTHKGHVLTMIRIIQKTEDGGAAYVTQNISELVYARNKLREQEAKSQYTSKLASLGEMAAGIAHEINNPLGVILVASNMIERNLDKEQIDIGGLKKLSQKIGETTKRIAKIIQNLKTLSRNADQEPFKRVNLVDVLEVSFDIIREKMKLANIELKVPAFSEPVYFTGGEVQISQVLTNLFSNSIDAVNGTAGAWLEVRYEQNMEGLDIYISDSGPGIRKEIITKIMEPFFTTKDVNQGTGLGLSISKTIIQSHQGELILVEDAPNTTFKIRLPNA